MATHLGNRAIQGLESIIITFFNPNGSSFSGYVTPQLQSLKLGHRATNQKIKNPSGNTGTIIGTDEYLECQFDYVPAGANDTQARGSAGIPANLATATIANAPVIAFGPFANAINTNGDAQQRWIYEADANLDGKIEEAWGGTITLRRYPDIRSTQAITA